MARAITIGQHISRTNRKQFYPERLVTFVKAIKVNSVIDLRPLVTSNSENSPYNSESLRTLFNANRLTYQIWSEKVSSLNVLLKGTSGKIFRQLVTEHLSTELVNYLAENPYLGYTALLFPSWEGERVVKGTFSRSVLENFSDKLELNHMIPRLPGKGFDVFTNDDLYNGGYGNFMNIRSDIKNRFKAEFEDEIQNDYGYDQSDIDHEMRGMNDEAGGSFYSNID